MSSRRWTDPESDAPERVRQALAAYDAEPSPHSRARGWARFSDPRERRAPRRPTLIGGAVAGLALATATVAMVVTKPAPPHLLAVELQGEVSGADGPLAAGAKMDAPASVRVGPGGRAVLRTAAGDTLRVGGDGRLEVRQEPSTRIELSSGSVDVEATPRTGGDRLTVAAGRWRVEVVGTRFTVTRLPGDHVRVEVREGRVRVVGPGHEGELGAGEAFDSRPAAPTPPSPRTERPELSSRKPLRSLEVLRRPLGSARGASATRKPGVSSSPSIGPEVARDRETANARSPAPEVTRGPGRATAGDPAPGAQPGSAPRSSAPRVARSEPSEALAPVRRTDPTNQRSAAPDPSARLDPTLDEVVAYRAARALKDAGRNAAAAARYAALIERWPASELAQVAYLDRIECLLSEGDAPAARAVERSFVDAHPDVASRPETSFVRAEVARALREHAKAATLYAAAARADRFAESASFLEAVSHARAGDTPRASDAMRAYLDRFPNGAHAAAARRALRENAR